MEIKISLARAFTIRKRLKEKIDVLVNTLTYGYSDVKYDLEEFPKGSDDEKELLTEYKKTVESYEGLSNMLADFNTAIDAANAQGPRNFLNKLEVLKRRLNLYIRLADAQKRFKPEERYYDNYEYNEQTKQLGTYKTRKFAPLTTRDFKAESEKLEKDIQALEDALSDENSKTFITFDGPLADALVAEGFISQ